MHPRHHRRIRWTLGAALALVLGTLAVLTGPATRADAWPTDSRISTPASSAKWRACTTTFWGLRVAVLATQRTVTVVNGTHGSYATVAFYARTDSACSFVRKFDVTGRIGYGGFVTGSSRKQGTGTTPTGTYSMTEAFGLKANPGTKLPYRRVAAGDFWVEDNQSRYYNNYRRQSQGGFRWWLPMSNDDSSERLTDYPGQYDYAVVINFNRAPYAAQRAHHGAGIFLHVSGKGATAGCVSVSRAQMITVLRYLKPGDRITIAR